MKKILVTGAAVAAVLGTSLALTSSAQADTVTTIRSTDFTPFGDVEQHGHVQFAQDGLSVVTDAFDPASTGDNAPSQSKAQEFWPTSTSLADAGEPVLDWLGTDTRPGINIMVDLDGNPSTAMYSGNGYHGADAILVGEGAYSQDGTPDWWATGSSVLANGAPSTTGGSGSNRHGTLDQWRTLYPNAKVVSEGFSLGSGARGSGVITQVTLGSTQYRFTGKDVVVAPPTTLKAPAKPVASNVGTASLTLLWTVPDNNATAYQVYRNGVLVGTTKGTWMVQSGLTTKTAYTFTVVAQGANGLVSAKSPAVVATTK